MNVFLFLLSPDANVAYLIALVVGLIGLFCILLLRAKILTLKRRVKELEEAPLPEVDHSVCRSEESFSMELIAYKVTGLFARGILRYLAEKNGIVLVEEEVDDDGPQIDYLENDVYLRLLSRPEPGQVYAVGIKLIGEMAERSQIDDLDLQYYKVIEPEIEDDDDDDDDGEEVEISLTELVAEIEAFAASQKAVETQTES